MRGEDGKVTVGHPVCLKTLPFEIVKYTNFSLFCDVNCLSDVIAFLKKFCANVQIFFHRKIPVSPPILITLSELWEWLSHIPSHNSLWGRTPLANGNSKELCAWAQFYFWNRYRVGEAVRVKKSRFFQGFKSLQNERFFLKNTDELRPHHPSRSFFFGEKSWLQWLTPPPQGILRESKWEWEFTGNGKHATIPWPFANAISRMAKGMTNAGKNRVRSKKTVRVRSSRNRTNCVSDPGKCGKKARWELQKCIMLLTKILICAIW